MKLIPFVLYLIWSFTVGASTSTSQNSSGPSITTKIFGGDLVTSLKPIPYQLSLRLNARHICGAIIIQENKALTAAHCLEKSLNASEYLVIAGDIDLLHIEDTEQVNHIKSIVVHPHYDPQSNENDIAILHLQNKFNFNNFVNKILLPSKNENISGQKGVASGWGRTAKSYGLSDILQKVELLIIPLVDCREAFGEVNIKPTMLCARGQKEGQDTCEGDSGGPLALQKEGQSLLIGITSWGPKVCGSSLPGVYTQVSAFTTWILKEMTEIASTTLPPSPQLVPLHRYFNGKDHFYTTNFEELGSGRSGYTYEGIAGKLYSSATSGTVPLHRYYNGGNSDHFYTTNWSELGGGKSGYKYEGIAGFVHSSEVKDSVALYRYYNPSSGDHFYTIQWNEIKNGTSAGYKFEGIQCYIYS